MKKSILLILCLLVALSGCSSGSVTRKSRRSENDARVTASPDYTEAYPAYTSSRQDSPYDPPTTAADSAFGVTQPSTTAPATRSSDTGTEAQLYTAYLKSSVYEDMLYIDDIFDSNYEAEACLVDFNGDGVRELLLKVTNKEYLGVRGYGSQTVLLGLRNGKPELQGYVEFGGGSGGGDYIYFKYDTAAKKHVMVYEVFVRDGAWGSFYERTVIDPARRDNPETVVNEYNNIPYGVGYNAAHKLELSRYSEQYYAEDIQRIKSETNLYSATEDGIEVRLYDENYITESSYNTLDARFIDPIDPAYQFKPVSLNNPIPN